MSKLRQRALLFVKGAITLALIALLVRHVDLRAVSRQFLQADPLWIAAAVSLLLLQVAAGAMRWQRLCLRLGLVLTPATALRLVFIGNFFSQALPTSIGGDAVRAWLTARETGLTGRSISSILCDRAIGLGALMVIASAGQLAFGADLSHPALATLRVALWGSTAAGIVIVLVGADLARPLMRFRIGASIWRVLQDVRTAVAPPWLASAKIIALSLVVHLSIIASIYSLGRALALPLDLPSCLLMVPPIMVATLIPVSIGGWGLREGAMVLGLGIVGVAAEGALALSILYGLLNLAISLPGGLLWIAVRGRTGQGPPSADEAPR